MSITKEEGLSIAAFVLLEDNIDDLNNNWNTHVPHFLDYDYTISNESLRKKIAQDIKKFYFGNQIISLETKNNLTKVGLKYIPNLIKIIYLLSTFNNCFIN